MGFSGLKIRTVPTALIFLEYGWFPELKLRVIRSLVPNGSCGF